MACSACAPAQSHTPSAPFDSAAHRRHVKLLITNTEDEASNLRDVHLAYAGLENLIAPVCTCENNEVHATRGELSALLRLINVEFSHRLGAVDLLIQSARESVGEEET
jgi:hypothetical protein